MTSLHSKCGETAVQAVFKPYKYDYLINRDITSLDVFWLSDKSLQESVDLPEPHVVAEEIAEDPRWALDQFAIIADDLSHSHDTQQ
jgi:type I restriction enzyme M protein